MVDPEPEGGEIGVLFGFLLKTWLNWDLTVQFEKNQRD